MRYGLLDLVRDLFYDAAVSGIQDALDLIDGSDSNGHTEAAERLRKRLAQLEAREPNGQLPPPEDDLPARRGPGRPRKS